MGKKELLINEIEEPPGSFLADYPVMCWTGKPHRSMINN